MSSDRYFTSEEPLTGHAPFWEDFRHPRLRRFPESSDNLIVDDYLGWGFDGCILKAHIRGQTEPLAVKVVRGTLSLYRSARDSLHLTRLPFSFMTVTARPPFTYFRGLREPTGTGLLSGNASIVPSWI